ncbi:MAG TPA: thiamine pyrophosphate-dependent enzyme, partial [Nitrososphaeraceae archaeon]|nr:thiamine pyrophosphate-dependent enzyme [Nitrososphaeraceae archaeon]
FSLSGTLASMGCGLPYAIAAQIAFPTRQSIAFVRDGGFNMLTGEFATDSSSIQLIPIEALTEKKPTIVEVYVDPFDPPMPPQVDLEFVKKIAESFAKGQPYAKRIGLSLYRNQIHERLRDLHHHS